jgi:mitochondrial fission protein ELM1
MKVLVIKDDKPGHYNQTEGLLLYLKEIYEDLEVEYIQIEIKSKLTRKILRFLLNTFPDFFTENSLKYLSLFYKKYDIPKYKPDLVISTGGNTSNLNVWFSKVYKCKNILNGALRGLKEEFFTYITTVIDLGYKNQIILDVAPNTITKDKLLEKSEEFLKLHNLDSNQKYYTLLIGGDGAGYKYSNKFYDDLIDFLEKVSKEKSIKWLITTSRRTPLEIENKLEERLKNYYSYFVSYNKKEEKVLLAFFGLSEAIFVTEESSSMISEAVSTLKSVYTIGVQNSNPDKNYRTILNKFVKNDFIIRIDLRTFEVNDLREKNISSIETVLNKEVRKIFGK